MDHSKEIEILSEYLMGTCHSVEEALTHCGITTLSDVCVVEHLLMLHNCERCEVCDWWHESCELSEDRICESCGE